VSARRGKRTQPCDEHHARTRLGQARKFLEVADLVSAEREISESVSVAAALTVLAGIAAADAACCAALGVRSRSSDHHDAEALLEQIADGGAQAASRLRRIITEKDSAHYGLIDVGGQTLSGLLRQARALVDFAEDVLRR
jgi:hypothetical protein